MDQMVEERVPSDKVERNGQEIGEPSAQLRRARARAQAVRALYIHVGVYLIVTLGLLLVNAVTVWLSGNHTWFFYWVALGWGIAVVIHAFTVYTDRFLGAEWEDRKVREYLNENR